MQVVTIRDTVRAEKYVRGELHDGTTLARQVERSIDLSKGRFRVAIPDGLEQNEALDFRYQTFHINGDEPTILAHAIKAFMGVPHRVVILQDTEASLSDPWLKDCEYRNLIKTYKSELYWIISDPATAHMPEKEILSIVDCASYHPFSAFFSAFAIEDDRSVLTDSDFDQILRGLIGVAVGAFDERSFLVWWRNDVPFPDSTP